MKINRVVIVFVLAFFVCSTAFSQNKRTKKADELFESGQYYLALQKYTKLYEKTRDKKQKGEIAFKAGECTRNLNIQQKAVGWYRKAIGGKYQNQYMNLYLAEALRAIEKYDEALVEYQNFMKNMPDDPRGNNGAESCKQAILWKQAPNRYIVENLKDINTKENDFCPSYARADYTEVYFTSSREGAKGTKFNDVSGMNFTDIFHTFLDKKGSWSEPTVVDAEINSEFDEGAVSIAAKTMKTIYFTDCKIVKAKNMGCQVYSANRTDEGWTKPEINNLFQDSSISVGHPAISPDENTMYFTAYNAPNGIGGRDIWMVKRGNKTKPWGTAINMGDQINTKGDEMFPFIREDGTLYFASNGHIGMGGLDIFMAKKDDAGKWTVENMKFPINSAADDYGIVFQGNEEKGLFTSNRGGGKGADDIWSFNLPSLNFNMKGLVKDDAGNALEGAKVKLTGTDGTILEKITLKDGTFKFDLKPNVDYIILGSKDNYLNGKSKETTKGLNQDKQFSIEISLTKVVLEKSIELPNIEYDFNSANLREESKVSLDKLVETLSDNTNISIELGSHTDFRGTDEANILLSQKRAESVVTYLISKGIAADRMVAKGYGESKPNVVKPEIAAKFSFLKEGTLLDEAFIISLTSTDEQEIAHQINRRTEFKILSMTYEPSQQPTDNQDKK